MKSKFVVFLFTQFSLHRIANAFRQTKIVQIDVSMNFLIMPSRIQFSSQHVISAMCLIFMALQNIQAFRVRSSTHDLRQQFHSRRKRHVIFSTFVLAQKHPFTILRCPVNHPREFTGFIDLLLHERSRSGQQITRHTVLAHSNEIFSEKSVATVVDSRVYRVIHCHFNTLSLSLVICRDSKDDSLKRKGNAPHCDNNIFIGVRRTLETWDETKVYSFYFSLFVLWRDRRFFLFLRDITEAWNKRNVIKGNLSLLTNDWCSLILRFGI